VLRAFALPHVSLANGWSMTHDETHLCWRGVCSLVRVTFLAVAAGYGCGQAPSSLFSSAGGNDGVASGSANSAGFQATGASGSASALGGSASGGAGNQSSGGGASSGGASAGAPSAGAAGNAPSAGAANSGGDASGGGGGLLSGMAGSGGASGPSACDGKLVMPPALIADFEQGVAGWYGYIGNLAAPVVSTEPGAAMTAYAARFSGGMAKISGMYFPMPCRDVSEFDGMSFWGRSETPSAVRFLAVIPKTDPTAGIGDCDAATMTCSDHPGKPFTFGPDWTLYHAAWSELKQLGFGAPASFDNVINAVLWINDGAVDHFNFSIDEVTFYTGTPPTPPTP
jgi:hypothetical protein